MSRVHTAPTGRSTRITAQTQLEVQLYNVRTHGAHGHAGLQLLHSRTRPHWLASARIQVARSGGGTTLPAASATSGQATDAHGVARFTQLDPGDVYDVRVTLPAFDRTFDHPALDLVARFRREPSEGSRPARLVAEAAPGDGGRWARREQPNLHPRVTIVGPRRIAVDVTFVEATWSGSTLRAHGLAFPTGSGLAARVFEYTAGSPCCWLVVTPDVAPRGSIAIGAVVFFRPAIKVRYLNTDDFPWGSVNRYFASPDASHPWFAQPAGSPRMLPWPNCGWYDQIHRANKPVVFVHPVPTGAGFGDASGSRLMRLLDALYVAMWDAHLFGLEPLASVQRNRLALAGFSAGGHGLFAAFAANAHAVDELYLFDPVGLEAAHQAIVRWAPAGGRKLRMAGYLNWGGLHALARHLQGYVDSQRLDLSLEPQHASYWSSPDELLARAIRWNHHQGAPVPPGVEVQADSGGHVTVRTAQPPGSFRVVGLGQAEVELVLGAARPNWQVHGHVPHVAGVSFDDPYWDGPPRHPPAHARQVELSYFVTSDHGLRHQWAVVGGTGDAGRGSGFTGYLQQWLQDSDFRVA